MKYYRRPLSWFVIAGLCLSEFVVTADVIASCSSGCSTTDSGACVGPSTGGSCGGCAQSFAGGPANCGSFGSVTSFTGTAIYGSTTGNGNNTYSAVPCKTTTACLNAGITQGTCKFALGWFVCWAAGMGGCQNCRPGAPVTTSTAQQCATASCGDW